MSAIFQVLPKDELLAKVIPLLGIPWREEANCWEFVRAVVKEFTGGTLPVHPAVALSAGGWEIVEQPEHLCICALARFQGATSHAGVYLAVDGGVMLHCMPPCSVITPLKDFDRLAFPKPRFYTYGHCFIDA